MNKIESDFVISDIDTANRVLSGNNYHENKNFNSLIKDNLKEPEKFIITFVSMRKKIDEPYRIIVNNIHMLAFPEGNRMRLVIQSKMNFK